MSSLLTALIVAATAALAAAQPAAAAPLPRIVIEPERGIDDDGVPARVSAPGYAGPAEIELRGQFSRTLPKKSYALELRDAEGENADAPLLGLPADDDWVLTAAYNDRTLMRNALAYETARSIGRYAARTRFVELRIRGRSRGVYVLTEKLKLHDDRVRGGDDAYLLELTSPRQAPEKGEGFRTPVARLPIVWEDPDRDELSGARAARIRAAVARAERAIFSARAGAWRRHLHGPSAVDHVLLNELFKNQDGMFASTFLTAPRPSAPLRLGPIWDFDISMGAPGRVPGGRASTGWMLADRSWARELYRDSVFARALERRWRELRRQGLRGRVLRMVDRNERTLRGASVRLDLRRWPAGRPHRPQGSYGSHVRFLEGWMKRRIAWIDRNVGGLGT
jgi:hypothetical protein